MAGLNSRKLLVAILASVGIGTADQLTKLSTPALVCIAIISVAYLISQGMADVGKEKAKEETARAVEILHPSQIPPVIPRAPAVPTVPSPSKE